MSEPQGKTQYVTNCARCRGNHNVRFWPFVAQPVTDEDGTVWDMWGKCPVTGEMVLMRTDYEVGEVPVK